LSEWEFKSFPTPAGAANYLNEPAQQGQGEATATVRDDGTVDLFVVTPGTGSASQQWDVKSFPTPADGVNYLNEAPQQGHGEATATVRDDGTVDLLVLTPGTGSASQQWVFQTFPTLADGVKFLNEPARQGPGEVSGGLQADGKAQLFYLSSGTGSASQDWLSKTFPTPGDAVNFLNEPGQQRAGEATAIVRDDGTVALVFLGQRRIPGPH